MKTLVLRCVERLLLAEARMVRDRFHGPVVAVTGSVGKTTTKTFIGRVIRAQFGNNIIVTSGNLNTELGLPLTMLGYTSTPRGWGLVTAPIRGLIVALIGKLPEAMVLELGADHPGDIAKLAAVARPTVALVTNISESHTVFLGSVEAVAKEKLSLFYFVEPNGALVLNRDNEYVRTFTSGPRLRTVTVGSTSGVDIQIRRSKVDLRGTTGTVTIDGKSYQFRLRHYLEAEYFMNAALALGVARALDISMSKAITALEAVAAVPGRGTVIAGKNGATIIDSTYNAQPAGVEASLRLLGQLPGKRKVAVLGDMLELAQPAKTHRAVGILAHRVADYIIGVGPESKRYKPDTWFATSDQAVSAVLRQLAPGVIVLVKGSQGIRMERITKAVMRHPNQAAKLLVRQSAHWLNKP